MSGGNGPVTLAEFQASMSRLNGSPTHQAIAGGLGAQIGPSARKSNFTLECYVDISKI
jgi:hypothetical protein